MRCHNCKAKIEKRWRYCPICRASLTQRPIWSSSEYDMSPAFALMAAGHDIPGMKLEISSFSDEKFLVRASLCTAEAWASGAIYQRTIGSAVAQVIIEYLQSINEEA